MEKLILFWYRFIFGNLIPSSWLVGNPLKGTKPRARSGRIKVEIVSHCWAYAHLQAYQLSSLVLNPPQNVDVTMTVFYSSEDEITEATLAFFAQQQTPNVQWNWQQMPKNALFRRAIGRNKAALETKADWVWFTDCDLLFGPGCLDALGESLQGRTDKLVYPDQEMLTDLLPDEHPALTKDEQPRIKSMDGIPFLPHRPSRATGPLQVVHGDVARAAGYCGQTRYFMTPVERWAKTYEDTVFRRIIRDHGVPISVPGVHRIRHQSKGRYKGGLNSELRKSIRKATDSRRT